MIRVVKWHHVNKGTSFIHSIFMCSSFIFPSNRVILWRWKLNSQQLHLHCISVHALHGRLEVVYQSTVSCLLFHIMKHLYVLHSSGAVSCSFDMSAVVHFLVMWFLAGLFFLLTYYKANVRVQLAWSSNATTFRNFLTLMPHLYDFFLLYNTKEDFT